MMAALNEVANSHSPLINGVTHENFILSDEKFK
jgi:hypothetical protein